MIEVRGLTKRFGTKVAVNDLTFTVQPGRVTGFLGPNGAGKSTSLRCMLLLDRPQAGTCTFAGKQLDEYPQPLREVGALLDAKYVHPTRSSRNHLRYLAASNHLPVNRVDECLAMVGLTEVAKARVGGFSLGMHQRLGLAAALLGDPQALLFDEPANGLDPEGIIWIRNFMRYLAGQGRTVLVSSHQLGEMSLTADDLVVIGRGELISHGTVGAFVNQMTTAWVRARSPQAARLAGLLTDARATVVTEADGALRIDGPDAAWVGELAARHEIVLHELSPQRGSLEEAFLEATKDANEFRSDIAVTANGPAGVAPSSAGSPLPPPPGAR
jgi:ABC-2 type transport system ATP-binding protein